MVMSNGNQNQDLRQVGRRLESLQAEFDEAVASVRTRMNWLKAVALIILVVVIVYFAFAYKQIKTINADLVMTLAADQYLQPYIPRAGQELRTQLIKEAPNLVKEGEKRLLEAPAAVAELAEKMILQEVDKILQEAEKTFVEHVRAGIKEARATIDQTMPNASEDEKIKQLLDDFVKLYVTEVEKMLNDAHKLYLQYAEGPEGILTYLAALAENKALDERGKLERKVVETTLALLEQKATGPAPKAPVRPRPAPPKTTKPAAAEPPAAAPASPAAPAKPATKPVGEPAA